ncbi:MAG TPA: LemA family protein [Desulfonatronum sp.]|nr:LemA family protein [Desulfonatronum sp.]
MGTLSIIPLFLLGLAVYVVRVYNDLIRKRNHVDEAFSGIDVQLKKRADLVPNLVQTVKGYARHERFLLEEVTRLRTQAAQAGLQADIRERARTESLLGAALTRLLALAESYPDLKANQNFLDLQRQLALVEDDLQLARRYFNGTVRNLNIRIESFPGNMVAKAFGFAARDFFTLEDPADRRPPEVAV